MPHQFPPAPTLNEALIKCSPTGITEAQLAALTGYGDVCVDLLGTDGQVGFKERARVDHDLRRATVAWFVAGDSQVSWVFDMLTEVVQDANSHFWRYDLWGFHDNVQYTVYDAESGGHFGWHMDLADNSGRPQRKLSVSILLSDPAEYEGGEFQYFAGETKTIASRDKGTAIVFPSWLFHRITPITRGVRKSLVAWSCGPALR